MKVMCIESVIKTNSQEEAFTKGKVYKIYNSTYRQNYNVVPCIKAKDNFNKHHVILDNEPEEVGFFEKHFKLTA